MITQAIPPAALLLLRQRLFSLRSAEQDYQEALRHVLAGMGVTLDQPVQVDIDVGVVSQPEPAAALPS